MHKNILDEKQADLFPFLKTFKQDFGLVGGTAIALHIGHRRSIDFDLFTYEEFSNLKIRNQIIKEGKNINQIFQDQKDEYTALIEGVKFTFFFYPFKINFSEDLENIIKSPNLLTLSAIKAYALGRRNKWKDYIDLYFIITKYHSLSEIIKKATKIFGLEFNEKIFRSQLSYFDDIDYSEKVSFMNGFEVSDEIIKKELTKISLEF